MYITLKSIKRNLGLFNLEYEDLIIGGIFILVFTILFLLRLYTISIVIISLGNQAGILVHLIAEYFTDYSFQTYNFIKEAQSQSRNQLCATF